MSQKHRKQNRNPWHNYNQPGYYYVTICTKDHEYFFGQVKNNKISDIKFETLGCAAAIAVSSSLTELVKGKTLAQALKITKDKIVKDLGGLPPVKIHCSMLAVDALRKAIEKYKKINK